MLALEIVLVVLTLFGSGALCIHFFNHFHSRGLSRRVVKTLDALIRVWFLIVPTVFLAWYLLSGRRLVDMLPELSPVVPMTYVVVCLGTTAVTLFYIALRPIPDRSATLTSNHTTHLNLRRHLGPDCVNSPIVRGLSALPGNQLLELSIHEKRIRVPRLPSALEGFTVTHLTDLHFTGKVDKSYYEEIIRHANALDADVIAVTGDLVEKTSCLEWIPDTFGRLQARYGVYYVLGNHDTYIDTQRLHHALQDVGLIPLGGRWTSQEINGVTLVLAGNEMPWLGSAADLSDCPSRDQQQQLRLMLSHSPDQIDWAIHNDADLVLAGHTHGGQIRLPLIGPLASASRMGTRYAGGTYDLSPTVLHVCRGISGTFPIRFNCPPELARLELHA